MTAISDHLVLCWSDYLVQCSIKLQKTSLPVLPVIRKTGKLYHTKKSLFPLHNNALISTKLYIYTFINIYIVFFTYKITLSATLLLL